MVSSTSEPRAINLLDILWDDNDVPQLKQILANLSPDDKFKLLSQVGGEGEYILQDVLYSICDHDRADIPENDPSLITSVLSGLSGKQRVHLLGLCDDNDYTPFDIFAFKDALNAELCFNILQNLFAGLTPSEKFQALMNSQKKFGDPLCGVIECVSVESVRLIREGLTKDQWESLLTINSADNFNYSPLIQVTAPSIARALLEGFDSKERARLLTAPDLAGELPITNSFGAFTPEVVTALLEGLDSDDRVRVLTTPNMKGEIPLFKSAREKLWDMVDAISNCLNDDEYIKILGCFHQDCFLLPLLIVEKNGHQLVRRLLERLSSDHVATLLSARNDDNRATMLEFMCKSPFFKEEDINVFLERLDGSQRLKVLTAPTFERKGATSRLKAITCPTPLSAILHQDRNPAVLLNGLSDEECIQVIRFSQTEDSILNAMVNNCKQILQDLNEDGDQAQNSSYIFLQALSPNLRARIFDLPDKDGITPKDILNGDLKKIDEGRKIIESIRDLFMVSHDGATTPQLDIRSKLRSVGSKHGRRLEPS